MRTFLRSSGAKTLSPAAARGVLLLFGGILLPAAEIQTTNFYYHGGCMPPRGWGYPNVLSILHLQDLNAGQCGEGGAGGDAGALCAVLGAPAYRRRRPTTEN